MTALVDLDRMKARLEQLDAEREPLLALIRAAEAYEGVVGRTLFEAGNVTVRQRSKPEGAGRAAPIMAATETAVSELLELMGPLGTSDLTLMLMSKPEVSLPEQNPVNVLSARLSNSSKFRSIRGVGWWFHDRVWPPEVFEDGESNGASEESPTGSKAEAVD